MKVTEFRGDGFRSLKQIVIQPGEGINVIYGQNAQGKTNLIEAIWLFSGARSFRSSKESKLIGFDCQRAELSLEFDDTQRIQKANMVFGAKNKYFLNRVELKSPTEYAGNFLCVCFLPIFRLSKVLHLYGGNFWTARSAKSGRITTITCTNMKRYYTSGIAF